MTDVTDKVTVDSVAGFIDSKYPELWRRLNTKFIQAPGTHHGFKFAAATLGMGIIEIIEGHKHTNLGTVTALLEKHDYPTYYLSGSLLQALQHTHPPTGMTWNEMVFPFDGIIFMLPLNTLVQPADPQEEGSTDEPIGLLGVCKLPYKMPVMIVPGTHLKVGSDPTNGWTEDRISMFWSLSAYSGGVNSTTTFPVSQPLEPSPDYILKFLQKGDNSFAGFASYMAGLAANLLLTMQARNTLVEHGQRTKRTLKSGLRIHTPTWIGRKYEILKKQHQAATPGAHFTELGWRAGHLKTQHFGKDYAETKIIFIDPYIAFTRGLVKVEDDTA